LFRDLKKKKSKGFTLVELLVVVAVLAVLAAVLLPRFLPFTERARQARAAEDVHTMRTIVEIWAADEGNGSYPTPSNDPNEEGSMAYVMKKHGIDWTGDDTGVSDPWGNPYYYSQVVPGE